MMHSSRFNRPIVITHHAAHRMAERRVTPELLLRVIDEGQTRYSDDVRLWVWLDVPGRDDNWQPIACCCTRARQRRKALPPSSTR